jgi:hypothetical protein
LGYPGCAAIHLRRNGHGRVVRGGKLMGQHSLAELRGNPKVAENALSSETVTAQFEGVETIHQLLGVLNAQADQHHPVERGRTIRRDLNDAPTKSIWANIER